MFNQIAETFSSKAAMRFIILLWGEKSSLACEGIEGIPVFSYKEIVDLGQESRRALFDSHDASKSISCVYLRTLLTVIARMFGFNVHTKTFSADILLSYGFLKHENK
jgi:hypothetical protein